MKRQLTPIIMAAAIAATASGIPVAAAVKEKPRKTELVTYATGPAGETDPGRLGVREVEVVRPDNDGWAALKTGGRFVFDVLTLPVEIVRVLWESATE